MAIDWPDWFRNGTFKRFYRSKNINSLDPKYIPNKQNKSRSSDKPRYKRKKRRRLLDHVIASCGSSATVVVDRPGDYGGTVLLHIGDGGIGDRCTVESVLRGKTEFVPTDLLNADLGTSPEDYYRKEIRCENGELPVGYLDLVPKAVVRDWHERKDIVYKLARLVSDEDWRACGFPQNPFLPARQDSNVGIVLSDNSVTGAPIPPLPR